jgi:type VI secretion system secreted protein VgrG
MSTYTQEGRLLSATTTLGTDVLLLTAFSGEERLSRLFRYELEFLSDNESIAAKDVVGKPVGWSVHQTVYGLEQPRYFHGVVSRFAAGPRGYREMRTYRAEVVPWFWFLTHTADCKIFQNKSTPDIVKAVFAAFGFQDYKDSLKGSYSPREYCVQYRETAFQFVSRLLEEEGIFYWFQHEEAKHTLVLADQASSYFTLPESPVPYAPGSLVPSHVSAWEHRYAFRTGKWTNTDYNFETPATSLLATTSTVVPLPDAPKYEVFDYPGLYQVKSAGDGVVKVRMGEEEAGYDSAEGASRCVTFTPGGKFTLQDYGVDAENQDYLVTAIRHTAVDGSITGRGESRYDNTFRCIPASVLFRPERVTPKPFVHGPQTAVVVGPSGEEIYVDKYGRVKVQFFWDRVGKKDENSSCWIRVAQHWAGKNWGIVFHPRIGQEVVVDFLEGDPDRPLITGRVYNAALMPPYDLPANMTQSGVKTRSSKGGGTANFNELRFEDKKGSEDIFFHAEKDFHREVENDDDLKVFHDQTITIKNNRTEEVQEGDEKVTIDKGNRTVTVSTGNDTHDVKTGNRQVTVETGNDSHDIQKGNRAVTIDMGNDTLTIKMGNQTTKLNLGASSTEAMQSITLKVGQNSVTIDQTGVTIKGMMVSIEGQIQTSVKGVMTQVQGSAMLQLSGGMIMIG